MSFNTGLSGIRAAASELNITGNNIANAGTVGFKGSRAEFADVYAASVLGSGSNAVGSGVVTGDVAQLFNQGAVNFTENSLDLAINGNGFFVTSNNGALSYTRAGYFGTDASGNIVNNFGERLQGYGVNEVSGKIQDGVPVDLQISTRAAEPNATTVVESTLNLNSTSVSPAIWTQALEDEITRLLEPTEEEITAAEEVGNTVYDNFDEDAYKLDNPDADGGDIEQAKIDARSGAVATELKQVVDDRTPDERSAARVAALSVASGSFVPADSSTYNSSTSVNVYDSQGNPHVMTKYFVKTGGNSWDMHVMIGNQSVTGDSPFKLNFDSTGKLATTDRALEVAGWEPTDKAGQPTGALPMNFDIDLKGSTQYAANFAVTAVSQDGYTTGDLAGLEINDEGLLVARYTNGQTKVQGQLALASFANQQGLSPLGKTAWAQSSESGEPVIGKPGAGTLGRVQSGALEQSNVDLSEQLINLIVAQRNYQANSKTIQTEDAVTQTIINLR
ncbi:flagellar hook protein FlgE [Pseudomonas sp. OIL-1]|uniref:flagellar hook protein FlgE n=1 Tax=Pseudomonas sp. OIL-1 TaxID=2706126 RepID=UPI0013A72D8D|nr:flagellar hook protein FlgE [Pseudomonas sp. OIL-1]QIB51621.1 flagellar hook protein FlgE [Pseudomonas sp. OIL-1]